MSSGVPEDMKKKGSKAERKLRKATTVAAAVPRGMVATSCIFLKGLWCGKRAGGYLVFGADRGFQPLRALGPQLGVFQDTNQLLESVLFKRSRSANSDAGAPPSTSTSSTSGDAGDDVPVERSFTQVGLTHTAATSWATCG